jgi:hypothetical protein
MTYNKDNVCSQCEGGFNPNKFFGYCLNFFFPNGMSILKAIRWYIRKSCKYSNCDISIVQHD